MLKVPRKKMYIHEINFSIQEADIFKIIPLLNVFFFNEKNSLTNIFLIKHS